MEKRITMKLLGFIAIVVALSIFLIWAFSGCESDVTSPKEEIKKDKIEKPAPSILILNIELEVCGVSYIIDDNFNGMIFSLTGNPSLPYQVVVSHAYGTDIHQAKNFYIERVWER